MNLITARSFTRQYARDANSSSAYSDFDIDTAIASVCSRFLRVTQYLTRTDTLVARSVNTAWVSTTAYNIGDEVTLSGRAYQCILASTNNTPPNATYWTDIGAAGGFLDVSSISTLASDVTSFHPKRMISAYPSTTDGTADAQTGQAISLVDYDRIIKGLNVVQETGGICKMAWVNPTLAALYPAPSIDYNVTLRWWIPFTVFTLGTQGAYSSAVTYYPGDVVSNSSRTWQCKVTALAQTPTAGTYWNDLGANTLVAPAGVTLNIPDDVLSEILTCGAPAQLQKNQPEHKYAADAWATYLALESSYIGAGGLGGNFNQTDPYPSHRYGPYNPPPLDWQTGG